MRFLKILSLSCIFFLAVSTLTAKHRNAEDTFTFTPSAYYQKLLVSHQHKKWKWAQFYGTQLLSAYPNFPLVSETRYLVAESFFYDQEYEHANRYFSEYLSNENNPKYFEKTIHYKFEIAKAFGAGARKHLLGQKVMPKWLSAKDEALAIYDEIITTFPRSDVAVQALYYKANLLRDTKEFKASVETYQTLIRRFAKHPLAPESYLQITETYLHQSQSQFPDPASLDLAAINLRRFREDFPGDPRVAEMEQTLIRINDTFAKDLFEIAKYYERVKKPKAAAIYYCSILLRYPETTYAGLSKSRLNGLDIDMKTFLKKTDAPKIDKSLLVESEGVKESL